MGGEGGVMSALAMTLIKHPLRHLRNIPSLFVAIGGCLRGKESAMNAGGKGICVYVCTCLFFFPLKR